RRGDQPATSLFLRYRSASDRNRLIGHEQRWYLSPMRLRATGSGLLAICRRMATTAAIAVGVIAGIAGPGYGACNIIPAARTSFRGTIGSVDRPFAVPGDVIPVSLDPSCDASSLGFDSDVAKLTVTLIFEPSAAAPHNAVILRTDCAHFEGSAEQKACEALLG